MVGSKLPISPNACIDFIDIAKASIIGIISFGRLFSVDNKSYAGSSRKVSAEQDGKGNTSLNIFLVSTLALNLVLLLPQNAYCEEKNDVKTIKGQTSANENKIIPNNHVQNIANNDINIRLKSFENDKPYRSSMELTENMNGEQSNNGIIEYLELNPRLEKNVSDKAN